MDYDVIIVLAGGIQDDGSLPETVRRRVLHAKNIYDQNLAPRIIMSGRWSRYQEAIQPKTTEAQLMTQYAVELGLPLESILQENTSHSTIENAVHSKKRFFEPNSWKKIIVVTSDFHLPRTKRVFDTVLGREYLIRYEAASTNFHFIKRVKLFLREKIALALSTHIFKGL